MDAFLPYIPIDRRLEMAGGPVLAEFTQGTALFADVSGFTRLTLLFAEKLGPQRGAEEVLPILNKIFDGLVVAVHRYRGAVISFSGDAITCWFDQDDGRRAVTAAQEMQVLMDAFSEVEAPGEVRVSLSIKVAIAVGPVRRFVIGDPQFGRLDVLAGVVLQQMGQTERLAQRGEIILTKAAAEQLGEALEFSEWRRAENGLVAGVVTGLDRAADARHWPPLADAKFPQRRLSEWVLPQVADRLDRGQGHYLAELRPAVALFVRFGGLDFEGDPDASRKLDRYIRWVQSIAGSYEGVLLQMTIGDKGSYYYIAFGAPVAHADDAQRAVATAFALQEVPQSLDFVDAAQIGIARGTMRTGTYGGTARLTYGILGEKVNLAAGLMGLAAPGEIFCDAAMYAAVRDRCQFEVVSPESLEKKAKAPLGAVYRLTGEIRDQPGLQPSSTRLVGRQEELATLVAAADEAVEGSVQLCLVQGEAGMGKSTLAADILQLAASRGFEVLLGSGSSIEPNTPYLAWREILRQFFHLSPETNPEERRQQVAEMIAQLDDGQLERLPLLNDMINLGTPENEVTSQLSPSLRHENLVQLIRVLLRARLENQPLLLVFEDGHWMDRLSWELSLRAAADLAESGKTLVIFWITRPLENRAQTKGYGSDLRQLEGIQTVVLDRLSDHEIRQLAAWELESEQEMIDSRVLELVEKRAAGNPLYAREMLLTLRERELIVPGEPDGWALASAFSTEAQAVPDTLQGLVLDRIDRLQPDQQTLLKVASVVGQTFMLDMVAEILSKRSQLDEDLLGGSLADLESHKLIERLEGGAGYQFNHIITRDVAYNTLLYAQRRELHLDVGGWYEGHYDLESLADFYPLLVYHFRSAEFPEREYFYLRKAADQSQSRFANREALDFLERALDLTRVDRDRFDIHLQREQIYSLIGERDRQEEALNHSILLVETFHDPVCFARVALRKALFEKVLGNYEKAIEEAHKVIDWGRQAEDPTLIAIGEQQIGQILVQQGSYDAAIEQFELALERFEVYSQPEKKTEVLGDIGLALVYKGEFSRAIPYFEQAIALALEMDLRIELLKSSANLAQVYFSQGNHTLATKYCIDGLSICRQIGDPRRESATLGNLGVIYRSTWKLDKALENFQQALRLAREVKDIRKEGSWLGNIGEVYLLLGLAEEALSYFEQALAISRKIGNRKGECVWIGQIGIAHRRMAEYDLSKSSLKTGLEISRAISDRNEEGALLYQLGLLHLDLEEWPLSRTTLEAALEIRRQLNQTHLEVECLAGLTLATDREGKQGESKAYLRRVAEYIEAHPRLEGTENPLFVLLSSYRVLTSPVDPRGEQIIRAAHKMLMSMVTEISEPSLQEAFLNHVEEARFILAEVSRARV